MIMLLIGVPISMASPLFDGESNIELTIEAPMRTLIRKKSDRAVYDALVRYTNAAGEEKVLNAQITTRGNARLAVCEFPPLRLIFNDAETSGTIFEGQKRLKMVTQCRAGGDGEKWVLQELGIYRAYNVITNYSYRTRRVDATYRDNTSSRWHRSQAAFFIEPTGELAHRVGLDSIRPPTTKPDQFDQAELANNLLFQLLIANTDLSIRKGPDGEGCCHNGRILTVPGAQENWVAVPYDFDQAGIINTEYALPDRRLGIRRVTQRKYRGFCWQNESLPAAMELLRERREAITAALIPAEFSSSRQARIKRFAGGFYKIIDNPKELKKIITDKCRGPSTFPIRKTTTN